MGVGGTRWCVRCERWGALLAACEGPQDGSGSGGDSGDVGGGSGGAKGTSYTVELMQCRQAIEAAPEKWKVQLGAVRKLAGTFKKRKTWPNQEPCDAQAIATICEILVSMALLPHSSSDLQHAAVSALRVLSAEQHAIAEDIVLRHIGYLLRPDPSATNEWAWWYSPKGMRELVKTQLAEEEEHTRWLKHHFEAMDLLFQSWSLGQSCMEQQANSVLAHICDLFEVYSPLPAESTTTDAASSRRLRSPMGSTANVGDPAGAEKASHLVEGLAKVLSRLQFSIRATLSHNRAGDRHGIAASSSPSSSPSCPQQQQGVRATHVVAAPVAATLQHVMQHASHLLLSTCGPSKIQHGAALACAYLLALDVPHIPASAPAVQDNQQQAATQEQGATERRGQSGGSSDGDNVACTAITLPAFEQQLRVWSVHPTQPTASHKHDSGHGDAIAEGTDQRTGDGSDEDRCTTAQADVVHGPLEDMSPFAALALWRAMVQTDACVALLQERHPTILHPVGFTVVCSIGVGSSDLQLRRFAVECLDAWLKATLKAMRPCAAEHGTGNPWALPVSDVVDRCARVVLHHVDDPVDKTRHQVRDLLESLIAFSGAAQTREARHRLHQHLLHELQRLPWSARGKYPCLQQLSRSIGVAAVLEAWPDLAGRLLSAMANEATAKPANTLFVDLAVRHRDECSAAVLHASSSTHAGTPQPPQSPFEAWAQQWLQPAVAALASGSDFLRKTLLELTIPKLFAVDRQCVLFAVRILRTPATHSSSALLALTALLRHSRAAGLLTQIPMTWAPTERALGVGDVSVFTDPVPACVGAPLQELGPVVSERPESDGQDDDDDDDDDNDDDDDDDGGGGSNAAAARTAVNDGDGDDVSEHPALVHVDLVKAALVHESAEIRSNMLGFLCDARKTKCVPSSFELRAVQFFLTWNKLVSSAERKGIERSLRKLLARLHTVFGSSKYKAATSHDADKEAVSVACSTFLQWLWHFGFQLLAPHEPFQTRALGQTVLDQIMLALPPIILCRLLSRPAHAVARATERDTGKHPDWTGFPLSCGEQRALALSLLDRYEINRLGAFNLQARLGAAPLDLTACFGHGKQEERKADHGAAHDRPLSAPAAAEQWVQRHLARVNHINTHFCALIQTLSYARLLNTPLRTFTRIDKMFGSLLAGERAAAWEFGSPDAPYPRMSQDERLASAEAFVQLHVKGTPGPVAQRARHMLWLLQQLRAKVDLCTPTSVVPLHGTMEALRHLLIVEPFVEAPVGGSCNQNGDGSKKGKKRKKCKAGKQATREDAPASAAERQWGEDDNSGPANMGLHEQHRLWSALVLLVWHEMKRVVECTMPTIASSAPEGFGGEAGGGERESPDISAGSSEAFDQDMGARMHLVCCWRAMREMAFITALLVLRFPFATTSKQVPPLHLTWTDALHMGKGLYTHLLQSRHRGVVEVMSSSFQAICSRLWSQFPAELHTWLDDAVFAIHGADRDSITRRSAGFPLLILSLLRSAPGGRRSRLVEACLDRLLAIARRQHPERGGAGHAHAQAHQHYQVQERQQQAGRGQHEGGSDDGDNDDDDDDDDDDMHVVGHRRNAAVVHAYNVIRAVMRDESVSKHCTDKVDAAYALAFDGFVLPTFAVRNAAMMLFSSLQTRLFGSSTITTTTTTTGAKRAGGLLGTLGASPAGMPLRLASSPAAPAPSTASGDRVLTLHALVKAHPGLADIVLTTLGTPPSRSNTHNKKAYLALVFLSGLDNRGAVPDGDASSEAARLALRMAGLLRVWAACADARVRRLAARAVTAVVPLTLVDAVFAALAADANAALGTHRGTASGGHASGSTTVDEQAHSDRGVGDDGAGRTTPSGAWNAHHGRLLQLCALVGTHAAHLDIAPACRRCFSEPWAAAFLSSATASAVKTPAPAQRVPWVVQAAYWQVVSALLGELNRRCEARDVLYCRESVQELQGIHGAVLRVYKCAAAQVKALTESERTTHPASAALQGEPGRVRFKTSVTRALYEAHRIVFGVMQAVGSQPGVVARGGRSESLDSCGDAAQTGPTLPVDLAVQEQVVMHDTSEVTEMALFAAVLRDPDMAQGALDFFSSGPGELSPTLFAAAEQALFNHTRRGSGWSGSDEERGARVCDQVRGPDATTALLACLQKPLVGPRKAGSACRITDARALEDALVAGHRFVGSSLDDVRLGAVALCGHAARQLCLQKHFTRDHMGLYLGALSSFTSDVPDTNVAIAVLEGLSALPAVLRWWNQAAAAQQPEMGSRQLLSGFALLLQVLFHDEPSVATRAASLVTACWAVRKEGTGIADGAGQTMASDASDGHRLNALASASRLLVLCDECLSVPGAVPPSLYLARTLATYVQEESVASGLRDLLLVAASHRKTASACVEAPESSVQDGSEAAAYGMVFLHNEALPLFPAVDVLALALRAADTSNDTHARHLHGLARAFAALPASWNCGSGEHVGGAGQERPASAREERQQDRPCASVAEEAGVVQTQPVWGYAAAGIDSPLDVVREMDVDRVDEICVGARHWPVMRLCSSILCDTLDQ